MTEPKSTLRIRRYPNRRLYDRTHNRYVTLQEIEQFVLDGGTIEVTDTRTGDDLTRQILTQILTERHPHKLQMFPVAMLHSMLRANDLAFQFWQSHFLGLLQIMENAKGTPSFPSPLNWLSSLAPSPTQPKPTEPTPSQVADLEARLRRLESQSAPKQKAKSKIKPKPKPKTPKK